MLFFENIFMLLFGHAIADFVLQPDAMGYGKNRNDKIHAKEHSLFPVWYYWLTAHALVHGGIVYMITGNIWLGVLETVLHWITDFAKNEGWIGMHQDQGIHISCKAGYAFLF
jgi:hypothetical protein